MPAAVPVHCLVTHWARVASKKLVVNPSTGLIFPEMGCFDTPGTAPPRAPQPAPS